MDTTVSVFASSIVVALVLRFGMVIPQFKDNFELIVKIISSIAFVISAIKMYGSEGDFLRKQEKRQTINYAGSMESWESSFDSGDIEVRKNVFSGDLEYVNKNTGEVVGTGKKNLWEEETITDKNGKSYTERKSVFGSTYTDSKGNIVFKKEKGLFDQTIVKDSNGNTLYEGEDNIFSDGETYKKK